MTYAQERPVDLKKLIARLIRHAGWIVGTAVALAAVLPILEYLADYVAYRKDVLTGNWLTGTPHISLKYGAWGFLIGAAVVVFFLCLQYLLSGRVHSAAELARPEEGMPILGDLPGGTKKRLDVLADRLLYSGQLATPEAALEILTARLQVLCRNEELRELTVVGAFTPEQQELLKPVEEALGADGITLTWLGDLKDPAAVAQLDKRANVILAATAGKTRFRDVDGERECCAQQQATVRGFILFP